METSFSITTISKKTVECALWSAKKTWPAVGLVWGGMFFLLYFLGVKLFAHPGAIALEQVFKDPENAVIEDSLLMSFGYWLIVYGLIAFLGYILAVSYTTALVSLVSNSKLENITNYQPGTFVLKALKKTPALVLVYLGLYVLIPGFILGLILLLSLAELPIFIKVLSGFFLAVPFLLLFLYIVVRFSLVAVSVAVGKGFFVPAKGAITTTKGWWTALGVRLFLVAMAAGLISSLLGVFSQFGLVFGLKGLLIGLLVTRVFATLVGTTLSAAQLYMLKTLEKASDKI